MQALVAEMPDEVMTLRNVGFRLLYDTCGPVTVEALAKWSSYSVPQVEDILTMPELVGRSRRDGARRLVGIAGLSVEQTRHKITIGGRTLWTWCALDAVGIFAALGESGQVSTAPPDGSDRLIIEFANGISQSESSLFILGGFDGTNSVDSWCPNVNFFSDVESATAWAEQSNLEGEVVSIVEAARVAEEVWAPVVAAIGIIND